MKIINSVLLFHSPNETKELGHVETLDFIAYGFSASTKTNHLEVTSENMKKIKMQEPVFSPMELISRDLSGIMI